MNNLNKQEISVLERAFDAEINAALSNSINLLQEYSQTVDNLVDDGLLKKRTISVGKYRQAVISGYVLTDAGRMAYCASCEGI